MLTNTEQLNPKFRNNETLIDNIGIGAGALTGIVGSLALAVTNSVPPVIVLPGTIIGGFVGLAVSRAYMLTNSKIKQCLSNNN